MQAIETRYHGPTNTRGARVSARCEAGRITLGPSCCTERLAKTCLHGSATTDPCDRCERELYKGSKVKPPKRSMP